MQFVGTVPTEGGTRRQDTYVVHTTVLLRVRVVAGGSRPGDTPVSIQLTTSISSSTAVVQGGVR